MKPVAIAGGGPAGLAPALTLARCGVASTVFGARTAPAPVDESRAITWMPGGLEFLDWAGITATFTGIGIRRHAHEPPDRRHSRHRGGRVDGADRSAR